MSYQIESSIWHGFLRSRRHIHGLCETTPVNRLAARALSSRAISATAPSARGDDFRRRDPPDDVLDTGGWMTADGAHRAFTACRNAVFLRLLSTSSTRAPGISCNRIAITMPGKPPPDPRSAQCRASGARSSSCALSPTCRRQKSALRRRRGQIDARRPFLVKRREVIKPRRVSRETSASGSWYFGSDSVHQATRLESRRRCCT
jgi:hypothetical protein